VRDAVVIGAGPAGAMTAHRLARQGFDVVLLEEHDEVGQPVHCTGLLGFDAFDEFTLPRSIILGFAETARFWGASGRSVTLQGRRARASVIDRGALDVALAGRAVDAGVDMRRGTRAETVRVADDRVVVQARGGEIHARACVLACGASYRFHRQIGLGVPEVFLQSAQIEVPFPEVDPAGVEVQFGRDVAPGGFAWMVPVRRPSGPHARIGVMAETQSRRRFDQFLQALCARTGADPSSIPAPRLKMLPLGPVARTYADRVVAVGDAAGLVKPTTGGGIYYGLVSGAIAGDVLTDALRRDRLGAAALAVYERRWRRRLGQEIRVGLAFRRIAQGLNDDSIDSLIDLARVNGIADVLQNVASFNWHRKAAIALLADASVRRIVFRSWRDGAPPAEPFIR
jgi:geranylgeranyl reductase family protein